MGSLITACAPKMGCMGSELRTQQGPTDHSGQRAWSWRAHHIPSHPTTPVRRRAVGAALPWALGTSLGTGIGQGPWLSRAGLWRAEDQPCCGLTGAGADSPRRLNWVLGCGQGEGEAWGNQSSDGEVFKVTCWRFQVEITTAEQSTWTRS